jgi:lycopene beta-cyclase
MKDIFTLLFRKNPPGRILKFLDEDTSFAEDLQIMASVPSFPFLQALAGVTASRLKTR